MTNDNRAANFCVDSLDNLIILTPNVCAWVMAYKDEDDNIRLAFQIHQHKGERISKEHENIIEQFKELKFKYV